MKTALMKVERKIRISGVLTLLGLAVEVSTLFKVHPLAFMAFSTVGVILVAAGMVTFLLSLLDAGAATAQSEPRDPS